MNLSLVIPVYNEEKFLETTFNRIIDALKGISYEIIIVDDESVDSSREIMKRLQKKYPRNVRCIFNKHGGKSQTVKTGILKTSGDYVVIQDADLEYDPNDVVTILNKIESEKLDVVYGNRFGKKNKVIYYQNWIGNTCLSLFSSLITGIRAGMWTRDMEVCYKMAKGDLFRKIGKTMEAKTTFGMEPELTAKFSKVKNLKFAQVPISYYPRPIKEGKKMKAFKHGFEALKEIIYFNFIK